MSARNPTCAAHGVDAHSRLCQLDDAGVPMLEGPTRFDLAVSTTVRVWRCSDCGTEAPWSATHTYSGSLECRRCQGIAVNHVSCGCKSARKAAS
jgi:hypothetical protein